MRSLLAVMLTLVLCATPALAGDGVQILPDATSILVSKDVGNERWAITLSLADETPLHVSGNVFRRDGGPVAFLWCPIRSVSGSADDIRNTTFTWDCFGSHACVAPPCGELWNFLTVVTLPGSFFLP